MPQLNKVRPSLPFNTPNNPLTKSQAIVIGAGPAGLATALHLHKTNNIDVVVYEIRDQPTTLGGAIAIPANGLRLLDRLGVYARIREGGSITDELILHARDGSELARTDVVSNTRARIGYEFMRVKRTVIIDALFAAMDEAGIPVRFGKRLVGVTEGEKEVTVTFEDGSSETADMLVGCDGIHSAVRSLHVNPGMVPEYSGVSSMGSITRMPTDLTGMNITLTPQGSIAVLPCTDANPNTNEKELFWFLTRHITPPTDNTSDDTATRDGWNLHGAKEVAGFKTTVQEIIHNIGGAWGSFLRQVIASTETVNFYPIYRLRRDGGTWHTRRCVLVGDAAHAMSPHVGQGVSMALEDVFLLSRLLQAAESSSLEDGLRRFERIRRPRVEYMAQRAANNGSRSRPRGPWQMAVMDWTLWAWSWGARLFGWSMWWGLSDDDLVYDIDEVDIENA